MNIGIIAEDNSDVEVMREITSALLRPHTVGFKKFVGDGCGKLRRKCRAWAENLAKQGCRWIAVVHDLDTNDEGRLRADLTAAMASVIVDVKVVVIPKREIEAWLLYDGDAIATAFRERTRPRLPGDPEALDNPKRHLRNVVWATYHKDYLNTIHNPQIARKVDLGRLSRSASFSPYRPFCAAIKGNLDREAALRRPGTARKRAGRRHR